MTALGGKDAVGERTPEHIFDKLIEVFGNGSQSAAAVELGVSRQYFSKMKLKGKIPVEPQNWVLEFERRCSKRGGDAAAINRHTMRPDVYPVPQ
jgi:hypothetical protein